MPDYCRDARGRFARPSSSQLAARLKWSIGSVAGLGGVKRAEALSSERRSDIARTAALVRWGARRADI